jgi:hypothetical protein
MDGWMDDEEKGRVILNTYLPDTPPTVYRLNFPLNISWAAPRITTIKQQQQPHSSSLIDTPPVSSIKRNSSNDDDDDQRA